VPVLAQRPFRAALRRPPPRFPNRAALCSIRYSAPGPRLTTANFSASLYRGRHWLRDRIADASSGTADIGASDAYLSSGDLVQNPSLLNIPLAISAQQVNYNLPQLRPGFMSG